MHNRAAGWHNLELGVLLAKGGLQLADTHQQLLVGALKLLWGYTW